MIRPSERPGCPARKAPPATPAILAAPPCSQCQGPPARPGRGFYCQSCRLEYCSVDCLAQHARIQELDNARTSPQ